MKKLWNLYTDLFGKTILHPQFTMLSFTYEAVIKARKVASKEKSLLDIGAGRPTYKKELENNFKSYLTTDKFGNPDIMADAHKLPFKNGSFDVALMLQVLEYLENPQQALKEASRVLKKEGTLILSSPFMYPIHDGKLDRNRFTQTQIQEFIKNTDLQIVKIIPQGTFFEFWIQNFLIFWFKSALKFPLLLIPAPILVPLLNLTLFILKPIGGFFSANKDFPLNILVTARKK